MFISNKYKIGFTHIPKTGGGTIKASLLKIDKKCFKTGNYHQPLTQKIANQYSSYLKFCIVRNSWESIISFYRYFVERKNLQMKFEDFIYNKISKRKLFPKQLIYIGGKENILVDRILNFDNLEKEYFNLCKEFSIPYSINTMSHSTKHIPKRKYYTKELVDFIYELCKEDIEYFKFEYRNV